MLLPPVSLQIVSRAGRRTAWPSKATDRFSSLSAKLPNWTGQVMPALAASDQTVCMGK